MLLLQTEPIGKGIDILYELGIAGVILAILFYVFYKIVEDHKSERNKLQLQLKEERITFQKQLKEESDKVSAMLDKTLALSTQYTKTTMELSSKISENEKENIISLNDVTTAINNVQVIINELRNDRIK